MKRLVGMGQLEHWAYQNRTTEATPEEIVIAEKLYEGFDGYESPFLEGVLNNGWRWQYPLILKSSRGKVIEKICDFYHVETRVNVELDGAQHKKGPDARRDRIFALNEILVLRFKNKRIHSELPKVMEEIAAVVKERMR